MPDKSPAFIKKYITVSIFFLGVSGIIYEYLLSLYGNYMMGSSFEQIFLVMGVVIASMGIGAVVQKKVNHLFDSFLIVQYLLALAGGFFPVLIYFLFIKTEAYIFFLYFAASCIGVLIGMEIPLLMRINKGYTGTLKENISEVLSLDYIGTLFGSFLFVYILLKYFPLNRAGFLTAIINLSIAVTGSFLFRNKLKWRFSYPFIALFCTVCLIAGLVKSDSWTVKAEQEAYADPVILSKNTRYQRIVLTKRKKRLRMYLNGQLQFSSDDEDIYHEMLVHTPMSLAKSRAEVLILGGGDGLALREVLKYKDVNHVTLVDIDPDVVKIASSEPTLSALNEHSFDSARVQVLPAEGVTEISEEMLFKRPENVRGFMQHRLVPLSRVKVLNIDADIFLKNVKKKYDVVLIDFPDPSMLELSKLYSLEFYIELEKHMNKNALFSVQSSSPYHANKVFLSIGNTLSAAGFDLLPYHENVPSFGEWGWYLGWRKGKNRGRNIVNSIVNLDKLKIDTRYISPDIIRASLVFSDKWLKNRNVIKVNSKMKPVILEYYNNSW